MDLRADARIPFPRGVVFAAYRDDIVKLLPYLSNVRDIAIKSRADAGAIVDMVNEWRGGGDIPAAIRVVLSESMLSWTDYAKWDAGAFACDWRTETGLGQTMRASGRNVFLDDGSGTLLEVRGTLEIDAKKVGKLNASRPMTALASKTARIAGERHANFNAVDISVRWLE